MAVPFGNIAGKVRITGSDIKNAVEDSFKKYNGRTQRGEFLQVSGLKIVIDLSKPYGQRIQSILARSAEKDQKHVFEELDTDEYYTVIMNEYMWENGDGFKFSKTYDFVSFGKTDVEILQEHLLIYSPISPHVEGRITILNADHIHEDNFNSTSTRPHESKVYEAEACGNARANDILS